MVSTYIATQIYAKICFETTPDKKKIVEMLSEYLADEDFSRIFILNGYAGTGKNDPHRRFGRCVEGTGREACAIGPDRPCG